MSAVVTARALGLLPCAQCGLLCRATQDADDLACPRCGSTLHARKPDSVSRTWAFLIASVILYIPANTLTVMRTDSLFGRENHTILGGVVDLWNGGSWDLAVIVFVASIVVPILKMLALALLAITAQRRSHWRQHDRARLYRMLEAVGHWSMLDVFVVALLVGLVRFHSIAEVMPGPGIAAFGAVVVLTMLSSLSLDPRLIWDTDNADDV
ncbi:MAG TPA: paraquat-inducible protein A [Rudaea sp.]|nr:paraquat-inducible protein A [Rudaea sp.]